MTGRRSSVAYLKFLSVEHLEFGFGKSEVRHFLTLWAAGEATELSCCLSSYLLPTPSDHRPTDPPTTPTNTCLSAPPTPPYSTHSHPTPPKPPPHSIPTFFHSSSHHAPPFTHHFLSFASTSAADKISFIHTMASPELLRLLRQRSLHSI